MLPLPAPHTQLFFLCPALIARCSNTGWKTQPVTHQRRNRARAKKRGTAPEEMQKNAKRVTGWEEEFWINLPCTQHKVVKKMCMLEFNESTCELHVGGGSFSPSLSVSHWDNGVKGVYGRTCVFGPAYKHPSELSSWQFVRNGGALKTITPHCVALQVFYYFNDRQQIAREHIQASFFTHTHRHVTTAFVCTNARCVFTRPSSHTVC